MFNLVNRSIAALCLVLCLAISDVNAQQCGASIDADIVILIDRTGGLSEEEIQLEKDAAISLLDSLEAGVGSARVAVATIEQDNSVSPAALGGIVPNGSLTTNYDSLRTVINSISNEGDGLTNLAGAIDLAQLELDANGRPGSERYIVLMSDGVPNQPFSDGCDLCDCPFADVAANVASSVAESKGTRVFGIHFAGTAVFCPDEPSAGFEFLRDELVTSTASNSFFFDGNSDLNGVLELIAGEVACDDGLDCTADICDSGSNSCIFDEFDTDSDGVGDCSDQCPADPEKMMPGECGCGVPDTDLNNNGTADCNESNDTCADGQECIFEQLSPFACAGANGFLNQTNIASVLNLQAVPLNVNVEYRDLTGNLLGSTSAQVDPNNRRDFVINDLGLQPDTYGTVCIQTSATEDGAWTGGVTVYKPNVRNGFIPVFGTDDDFALFHPFTNPRRGVLTQSLNTFHLGVRPDSTVANWLSITDAIPGDGRGLTGRIVYFDANGVAINETPVSIFDGGRFDYAAHEGVAGPSNTDTVGMARFIPDSNDSEYYVVLIRYFYDCFAATCADFHTAFVVPFRPATNVETAGNISTINGELSVVEVNNVLPNSVTGNIVVSSEEGAGIGNVPLDVPANGVRHTVMNRAGALGFLDNNRVGAARVQSTGNSAISAVSVFYQLNDAGILQYAYASPLVQPAGTSQVADFNTFIGHTNQAEVFNPSDTLVSVNIRAIDVSGAEVANVNVNLDPRSSERLDFSSLPRDTFGVYIINSEPEAVVFRSYVIKEGRYVLPSVGQ